MERSKIAELFNPGGVDRNSAAATLMRSLAILSVQDGYYFLMSKMFT